MRLVDEPAFRDGDFFALNPANLHNADFGRLPGETASGHWLYAFLRSDSASSQRFLVAVNLHPTETLHRVRIQFPEGMLPLGTVCIERLTSGGTLRLATDTAGRLDIGCIPPLSPFYFELLLSPPFP